MFVLYFPQFSTQIYQILLSYAYFSYIEYYMREIIYTSLPIPSSPRNVQVISVHNVTFMLSTVENSCFFSNKQFHNFLFYLCLIFNWKILVVRILIESMSNI